jgi:lantibiotic modifying enzyme
MRQAALLFGADRNWCWGAAGMVQGLARIMVDLGFSPDETHHVLAAPIETLLAEPADPSGDVSLCHGWAGKARAVGDACRLLGDPDGARRAHEQLVTSLRTVPANGYRGGLAHSAGLPTFMLGLSGVGHALLAAEGLPSALLLEIEETTC